MAVGVPPGKNTMENTSITKQHETLVEFMKAYGFTKISETVRLTSKNKIPFLLAGDGKKTEILCASMSLVANDEIKAGDSYELHRTKKVLELSNGYKKLSNGAQNLVEFKAE